MLGSEAVQRVAHTLGAFMHAIRRDSIRLLVLVLVVSVAPRARSQSFDCNKASTSIEDAICSNAALGHLDSSLERAFEDALSRAPDDKVAIMRAQRHWRAARDQKCARSVTASRATLVSCVAQMYADRIGELQRIKAKPHGASEAVESCHKLETRYRVVADAHPGEAPLTVLSREGSGVQLTDSSASLREPGPELLEWGLRQTPSISISPELLREASSLEPEIWEFAQLPGTTFYSVSSIQGTAHCYDSHYMSVRGGIAGRASPPPGFGREADDCGVLRSFGLIDATPVYFEESYDWTPRMTAAVTVATWQRDGFIGACRLELSYAPRFTPQTLNRGRASCSGPQCVELQRAALQLAAAVQRNPADTRRQLEKRLSKSQAAEYEAALALALAPSHVASTGADVDPGDFTDTEPLRVPYLHQNHALLVSVGHFTIGWRYYADWSVRFESVEQGQLRSRGEFAVGMQKGALLSTEVTPLSAAPN